MPGDIVLADRGFNIGDSVGFYCASLKMPAFTKGRSQLSALEAEETRKLANVCIQVKRVIGLVRRKYQILQSRAMHIENMSVKGGDQLALIHKIGVICCALTNVTLLSHRSKYLLGLSSPSSLKRDNQFTELYLVNPVSQPHTCSSVYLYILCNIV